MFLQKQQGYPASQTSVCLFYDIDLKINIGKILWLELKQRMNEAGHSMHSVN